VFLIAKKKQIAILCLSNAIYITNTNVTPFR